MRSSLAGRRDEDAGEHRARLVARRRAGHLERWSRRTPGAGTSTLAVALRLREAAGSPRARSVRMWNVAEPATISTSCSAGAQLERHSVAGQRADDVDEQPRRQDDGAVADDLALERDAQADLHVGGAQLDGAAARPGSWTPESAWTALRVEAARVTVWSWVNSASRDVEIFMWTPVDDRRSRGQPSSGAVDGVHKRARIAGEDAVADGSARSLSSRPVGIGRAAARVQAVHGVVGVGVARRCARRCACRRAARSCGCGCRRRGRSPAASRRSARARGTWRPGAARRRPAARLGGDELVDRDAERPRRSRRWISSTERGARAQVGVEAAEDLVGERRRSTARPVSEPKATTRISAPSSARTLESTRSAISSSASSSTPRDAVLEHALAQDRQARAEVGRLDVGTPGRPRSARAAGPRARRGRAAAGRR